MKLDTKIWSCSRVDIFVPQMKNEHNGNAARRLQNLRVSVPVETLTIQRHDLPLFVKVEPLWSRPGAMACADEPISLSCITFHSRVDLLVGNLKASDTVSNHSCPSSRSMYSSSSKPRQEVQYCLQCWFYTPVHTSRCFDHMYTKFQCEETCGPGVWKQ